MIPVCHLDASFLFEQVCYVINSIKSSNGKVISVICDGNQTNQAFFNLFERVEEKPWLTKCGIFLLFDYVHLLKSIRNNWITKKTQELHFEKNQDMTAKWSDLKCLFDFEKDQLIKLSRLNFVAIHPKLIERQNVSHCLIVFCDETIPALKTYSKVIHPCNINETIWFLEKVTKFWKIVSVKEIYGDTRFLDSRKRVISEELDLNLQYLLDFRDMALKMSGKQGCRIKSLTRDTGTSIWHTCYGLVEMCKYLLKNNFIYVMLGKFLTDYIEKAFSKFRQGSGGTYFITVQNVFEKLNIEKAKLLLELKVDVSDYTTDIEHLCQKCDYVRSEESCDIINQLPELEPSLPLRTKMTLFYIAGYVTRKDDVSENELLTDTGFYFQLYGGYTKTMDRGGLSVPLDCCVQWFFFLLHYF
ncbi:uncharacterized protein LOC136079096 [Hydra vulgaris]|uniref:Uncharacterized protein LOC136079096 n=1 Tax=Hydra vulgaris TaxID=6087 RepID=A0ABM4BP51_HYDVU